MATAFAAAIVCLLTSILLFARRKDGERSRVILACIIFFSVYNYITRFFDLSQGYTPELVISVELLLMAIFMVTSYIMYPIEVISPGFLTLKRIVGIYTPWLILVGIFLISRQLGVVFSPYGSLQEMLNHVERFHVWFRLLLASFIFIPVLVPFFIPYTRRYNNADKTWMRNYSILLSANCIAYILVLCFDHIVVKTIYYFVSVGCSLGIAYMELFVRLIGASASDKEMLEPEMETMHKKYSLLSEKLNLYMESTNAYRDPDLSIASLSAALHTNRTSLARAIHDLGYESFSAYINLLRIHDFIEQVKNGKSDNFQLAFYTAGFRSRATAIRNFRQVTGTTPSYFFQGNNQDDNL